MEEESLILYHVADLVKSKSYFQMVDKDTRWNLFKRCKPLRNRLDRKRTMQWQAIGQQWTPQQCKGDAKE